MTHAYAIVEPDDVEEDHFPESGIPHRKLTEALGATEMRVNIVTLPPGAATASHTHERQEEIYVALDGGHVELDGDLHAISPGTVVRVDPETTRSIHNRGDEPTEWVLIGAPPFGTVADFGEYRMPDS